MSDFRLALGYHIGALSSRPQRLPMNLCQNGTGTRGDRGACGDRANARKLRFLMRGAILNADFTGADCTDAVFTKALLD